MAEQSILTVISRQSKTKGRTDDENRSSCKGHKKRIATVHRQPSWNGSLVEKEILKWAAAGAALGSIVPVIGTGIGAAIGGTLGLIFGKSEEKKIVNDFTITPHCAHRSDGLCAIFPPEPQNHTPYPLKTAQNGADDFWGRESLCSRLPGVRFQCDPILNCQKTKKIWLSRKRWTGRQFIAESWSVGGVSGAALTRDQRGWKPFARTPIRDRALKRFVYTSGSLVAFEFTHRFSHLWRNVYARCFYFWFYKFRSQSQLTCLV